MTQTAERALVGRVVNTIRWAVGVVRGLPQQSPPAAELEGAAEELAVAANALEHLSHINAESRYRDRLRREGFDIAPTREFVRVAAIFSVPSACPRCGSLEFSADAVTWSCESCGHTAAWAEVTS